MGADAIRLSGRGQHFVRGYFQAEFPEERTAADRRAGGCSRRVAGFAGRDRRSRSGAQTLTLADGRAVEFPIDAFAKHCLLEGVDELGYILQQEPAIAGLRAASLVVDRFRFVFFLRNSVRCNQICRAE